MIVLDLMAVCRPGQDSIYGTHYTHMSQFRDASKFQKKPLKGKRITPLTMEEATMLSTQTLDQCCKFFSWICVDEVGHVMWVCYGLLMFT